jgi:hypothetical protein
MINVPHFKELSAKSVMDEVQGNPIFQLYLPDFDTLKKPLTKEYLFNVSFKRYEAVYRT